MAAYGYERAANEAMVEWLTTDGHMKKAEDAINAFTRLKVREDGVHRRIQEYLPIGNDELDRGLDEKPRKFIDKEPDGPASISVPFATNPINVYIKAPRYAVTFSRIQTPNFTKEIDELRTWHMDIRQVLSDNAIKDMLYEEDRGFFEGLSVAMGGVADGVSPFSGAVQWKTIPGGMTRDGEMEAMKILGSTFARLETHTVLINNLAVQERRKWGRDEAGGDYSQDLLKNGFSDSTLGKARLMVTIKQDLVPNDTYFLFAHEKFMGKAFSLEDTTMCIERRATMLNYFAYETIGSTIANAASVGRSDHG